jgi:predicted PurR-regulated permease PerM
MENKYTYLRGLVTGLVLALVVTITVIVPPVAMAILAGYIVYSAIQWFKRRREYALGLLTVVFAFIIITIVIAIVYGLFIHK